MGDLQGLYTDSIARFLKTVVCFDDEVYWSADARSDKSLIGQKLSDGFNEEGSASTNPDSYNADFAEKGDNDSAHLLDAQELTNAFAEKGILFSVVNPGSDPKEMERCIARMARTADVVILDWEMPGKDHSLTQNAIAAILEADKIEGGCLRLIVIYSAANGEGVIGDLEEALRQYEFKKLESGFELKNENALIVFLNKPDVYHGTSVRVDYKDLPDRIIKELLKLTEGLLPSTALRAVSLMRERSHHLLAKFPARLDGAYIVHRALIPDPNDAETFLLDLLLSELSSILASPTLREPLNGASCFQWFRMNQSLSTEEEPEIKQILTQPSGNKIERLKKIKQCETAETDSKKAAQDVANKLFKKIYNELEIHDAKADMAVLSTLERDIRSLDIKNNDSPRLKLGVIVRNEDKYFLCFQPLCDSVRIQKETLFPFLALSVHSNDGAASPPANGDSLDICIRDKDKRVIWLGVDTKPCNIVSYRFKAASKKNGYVAAELKNGTYFFRSTDNLEFEWCADLKIGKAQRLASVLASRIHTLGIDEFEWMRLHQRA